MYILYLFFINFAINILQIKGGIKMYEIFHKLEQVWNYLFIKGGIIFSFLLTLFLNAIGFPKQCIYLIIFLIIADIGTRWYAVVKVQYGKFNLSHFFLAWKEHNLNSKKLKIGFFTKIVFYAILLVIAHQASIVPEFAFGATVSNFMYSAIIILDIISIGENMVDAGFTKAKAIVDYLKKKKDELFGKKENKETE
jgi:hypothetical protein